MHRRNNGICHRLFQRASQIGIFDRKHSANITVTFSRHLVNTKISANEMPKGLSAAGCFHPVWTNVDSTTTLACITERSEGKTNVSYTLRATLICSPSVRELQSYISIWHWPTNAKDGHLKFEILSSNFRKQHKWS